jgi:hypothetical protein
MRPIKNTLEKTLEGQDIIGLRDYIEDEMNFGYDPKQYVNVVEYSGDKFSNEFIKSVYKILISWGMNSQGAKLSDFTDFKESIISNKETIQKLQGYRLEEIDSFGIIEEDIKSLFENLNLVKTNSKFVTFAKTMHFFVPNLLMPMDGKYTVTFFYGNASALYYGSVHNRDEKHRQMYKYIFEDTRKYARKLMSKGDFLNDGWSRNVPKLIDSLIIAYVKKKNEKA